MTDRPPHTPLDAEADGCALAAPPVRRKSELTTREAADFLGLSVRTFWRVAAPKLRARRYSARTIRWPLGQLQALQSAVTDDSVSLTPAATHRTRTPGIAALLAKHGCIG